jgi:hypothetical protein
VSRHQLQLLILKVFSYHHGVSCFAQQIQRGAHRGHEKSVNVQLSFVIDDGASRKFSFKAAPKAHPKMTNGN